MFRNMLDYHNSTSQRLSIDGRDYKTERCQRAPDVILGLSFGINQHRGSINHGLALSVLDIRKHFQEEIPAIVQDRMGPCLEELAAEHCYRVGRDADYSRRLDSHDILQLSIERAQAERLSLKSVLYVAHPAHVQRVMECGARMGLVGPPFVAASVRWSERDQEGWVRTAARWVTREVAARVVYKVKGYT